MSSVFYAAWEPGVLVFSADTRPLQVPVVTRGAGCTIIVKLLLMTKQFIRTLRVKEAAIVVFYILSEATSSLFTII